MEVESCCSPQVSWRCASDTHKCEQVLILCAISSSNSPPILRRSGTVVPGRRNWTSFARCLFDAALNGVLVAMKYRVTRISLSCCLVGLVEMTLRAVCLFFGAGGADDVVVAEDVDCSWMSSSSSTFRQSLMCFSMRAALFTTSKPQVLHLARLTPPTIISLKLYHTSFFCRGMTQSEINIC